MTAPPGWGQPPGALAPSDERPEFDDPDGAGIFSSYADFQDARAGGDGSEIAFAGLGLGLDALGFVADPFESLISAGVGWLIEHISFLHEPLDALAGDPKQIEAAANAWHALSLDLATIADELRGPGAPETGPATALPGWDGAAGEGYELIAADRARRVDLVAAQSDQLATSLLSEGATIGAVRSIIRDWISDLVAKAVGTLAAGLLGTVVTFGSSLAAASGAVILEAVDLSWRIADRLAELVSRLGAAGRALADGVRRAAELLGDASLYAHFSARPLDKLVGNSQIGKVVEFGKQHTSTELEDPAARPG